MTRHCKIQLIGCIVAALFSLKAGYHSAMIWECHFPWTLVWMAAYLVFGVLFFLVLTRE